MRDWHCVGCFHEVVSSEKPPPIHWDDGHICMFIESDDQGQQDEAQT
jgi:hypothetical protein